MAKKVTVTLVDDFDGEATADETVEFGLDGVTYEIDLSGLFALDGVETISCFRAVIEGSGWLG
ncbi:Lsr2 dimerization domain-containing protein, partial [Mycolicibacterium smegmatis]|uniref:Lsr2 dimerization domain-containing protein n=1 Tax=Mycolicibacterium smegmatis TaxID=1772 RepID=UPI00209535BE